MWIKTQKGNYCNLDRVASVMMSINMDRDNPYSIHVFSGEDSITIFSGTKDQCREVMEEVAMWILPHELNSIAKHTKPE